MRRLLPALALLALAACEAPQRPLPPSTRPVVLAPEPAAQAAASTVVQRLGAAVRSTPAGALVIALDLDGAAARAGVQIGDVVIGVNGTVVATAADLERALSSAASGALQLDVVHGGEARLVSVAPVAPDTTAWNALGLQVRELPRETLRELGVSYGLMVSKVRPPADRTRILPGDVIVGVNQTPIHSLEEFNQLVAERAQGLVALLVHRADADLYISFGATGRSPLGAGSFKTGARGKPLRT